MGVCYVALEDSTCFMPRHLLPRKCDAFLGEHQRFEDIKRCFEINVTFLCHATYIIARDFTYLMLERRV